MCRVVFLLVLLILVSLDGYGVVECHVGVVSVIRPCLPRPVWQSVVLVRVMTLRGALVCRGVSMVILRSTAMILVVGEL